MATEGADRKGPDWVVFDGAVGFGGHQEMTARILEAVAGSGSREVLVLLHEGAERMRERLAPLVEAGRIVVLGHAVDPRRFAFISPFQFGPWFSVVRRLRSIAPGRLVCTPGGLESSWRSIALALASGVPTTVYVPNTRTMSSVGARFGSLRDRLILGLLRRAARVVVIAAHQRVALIHGGIDGTRVGILENFLPRGMYPEIPDRVDRAIDQSLRVGLVGRIDRLGKGLDLLEDLATLPDLRHEYHIVGEGPDREVLESRLRGTFHGDRFRFHGWTDPWALGLDVLLHPSRMEGVPLVVLEAILRGIPVLARDLEELRELLPREFLYEPGSWRSVEDALSGLVRPEALSRLGDLNGAFRARFLRSVRHEEILVAFEGSDSDVPGFAVTS